MPFIKDINLDSLYPDYASKLKSGDLTFLLRLTTLITLFFTAGSPTMKIFILLLLAALASAEFEGLLNSMPADVLTGLMDQGGLNSMPADALKGLMDQGGKETMSGMDSFKSGPQKYSISTPFSPSLKSPVAGKVLKKAAMVPIKK